VKYPSDEQLAEPPWSDRPAGTPGHKNAPWTGDDAATRMLARYGRPADDEWFTNPSNPDTTPDEAGTDGGDLPPGVVRDGDVRPVLDAVDDLLFNGPTDGPWPWLERLEVAYRTYRGDPPAEPEDDEGMIRFEGPDAGERAVEWLNKNRPADPPEPTAVYHTTSDDKGNVRVDRAPLQGSVRPTSDWDPEPAVPAKPALWPDGTVRLPDPLEAWLDGHFAGEKDDDGDELDYARWSAAVALWSLIHRKGDPETDEAALDVIASYALNASAAPDLPDEVQAVIDAACKWADGSHQHNIYGAVRALRATTDRGDR